MERGKLSIEEFAASMFPDSSSKKLYMPSKILNSQPVISNKTTTNFEELYQEFQSYNDSIYNLDIDYVSIKPTNWFLVRAKLLQPSSKNGIDTTAWRQQVVQVQSGIGVLETVQSKYQFSEETIIIATPSFIQNFSEDFTVGKTIQVRREIVVEEPRGRTEEGVNKMPYFYTLPEWSNPLAPTNPKSKHFGYFAVPREMVICALTDRNKEYKIVNFNN